jgi:hypothetical protein
MNRAFGLRRILRDGGGYTMLKLAFLSAFGSTIQRI